MTEVSFPLLASEPDAESTSSRIEDVPSVSSHVSTRGKTWPHDIPSTNCSANGAPRGDQIGDSGLMSR
jgi:hypothetical protein